MGIQDLRCMASGLAILSDDTRCVFFYLRGSGNELAPITLPMRGAWDGHTPALDEDWHSAAVAEGLALAADAGAITRHGKSLESRKGHDIDLDIVAETLGRSSAAHVLLLSGEPVTFGAVIEGVYDAIVASRQGAESRSMLDPIELCRRAVPDPTLLETTYAHAPEASLRDACLGFLRWRDWFEASNRWEAASGAQYDRDDVEELLEEALPKLRGHGDPSDQALAKALAAYRAALPEEEPESDDGAEARANADARWAQERIVLHLRGTLLKRPNIDPTALAGSIEMYRMLQNVSPEHLPAGRDMEANKASWRKVIERVGTSDVEELARALMKARA